MSLLELDVSSVETPEGTEKLLLKLTGANDECSSLLVNDDLD
jgi:hypothetical protein